MGHNRQVDNWIIIVLSDMRQNLISIAIISCIHQYHFILLHTVSVVDDKTICSTDRKHLYMIVRNSRFYFIYIHLNFAT